jgi:hypothetical protein
MALVGFGFAVLGTAQLSGALRDQSAYAAAPECDAFSSNPGCRALLHETVRGTRLTGGRNPQQWVEFGAGDDDIWVEVDLSADARSYASRLRAGDPIEVEIWRGQTTAIGPTNLTRLYETSANPVARQRAATVYLIAGLIFALLFGRFFRWMIAGDASSWRARLPYDVVAAVLVGVSSTLAALHVAAASAAAAVAIVVLAYGTVRPVRWPRSRSTGLQR